VCCDTVQVCSISASVSLSAKAVHHMAVAAFAIVKAFTIICNWRHQCCSIVQRDALGPMSRCRIEEASGKRAETTSWVNLSNILVCLIRTCQLCCPRLIKITSRQPWRDPPIEYCQLALATAAIAPAKISDALRGSDGEISPPRLLLRGSSLLLSPVLATSPAPSAPTS